MTDEAMHRVLLDQVRALHDRKDADNAKADARHDAMMAELRAICAKQDAFARCHDECAGWRAKHAIAHGLDENKTPSVWVANCTAWAWHHPKRTMVGMLVFVALFISDFRMWLVSKATWALSLWLAG